MLDVIFSNISGLNRILAFLAHRISILHNVLQFPVSRQLRLHAKMVGPVRVMAGTNVLVLLATVATSVRQVGTHSYTSDLCETGRYS